MSANNRGNQGIAGMDNLVNRYAGLQPNNQPSNQYSGIPSGNEGSFDNNGFTGDSGGGYPGMAPGPYSNTGSMMMGQNPYQQKYGGGFQGMYNQGSQYSTYQAPKIGANSTVAMQPNGSMGFVDPYGTGSSQQMPVQNTQQPSTSTQSNGTVGVDPVTGRLVFK